MVTNATLNVVGDPDLYSLSGNGTDTIIFVGEIEDVNATLSTLIFTGALGYTGEDADIDITVVDFFDLTSSSSDTIDILVSENSPPVLDNSGDPYLVAIEENIPDSDNDGTPVSFIIDSVSSIDMITDTDGDPEGIAVTGVDTSEGTWQFSTNGGSTWTDIDASVSDTAAVVLSGSDLLRFVPNPNEDGISDMTFRAWDGSDGSSSGDIVDTTAPDSSITPFSTAQETATINVLDDSDTVDGPPDGDLYPINPGESFVIDLGETNAITASGDSDYDMVYYERRWPDPMTGPSLLLDWVVIEVSNDLLNWTEVFYWGNTVCDTNVHTFLTCTPPSIEPENKMYIIADGDLYGTLPYQTGFLIDIDARGATGTYRYVRLTDPDGGGGAGDGISFDSVAACPSCVAP
jgi:hypothetical protein